MYIGHLRLCVCLSLAAFPHYCTDPDVTWGNGRGFPLVVRYWADLQLKVSASTRSMAGLLLWSPYVIGQTIIFLHCDFYLLLLSSFFYSLPNLSCICVDRMTLSCLVNR